MLERIISLAQVSLLSKGDTIVEMAESTPDSYRVVATPNQSVAAIKKIGGGAKLKIFTPEELLGDHWYIETK
jgi:hypothetical protein